MSMSIEKIVLLSLGFLLGISAMAFLITTSVTGQAYYERGSTLWAPRIVPSKCFTPTLTCLGQGDCPSGYFMVYLRGYPQGCISQSSGIPVCGRFGADFNGRECNIYDPNTAYRCVCL